MVSVQDGALVFIATLVLAAVVGAFLFQKGKFGTGRRSLVEEATQRGNISKKTTNKKKKKNGSNTASNTAISSTPTSVESKNTEVVTKKKKDKKKKKKIDEGTPLPPTTTPAETLSRSKVVKEEVLVLESVKTPVLEVKNIKPEPEEKISKELPKEEPTSSEPLTTLKKEKTKKTKTSPADTKQTIKPTSPKPAPPAKKVSKEIEKPKETEESVESPKPKPKRVKMKKFTPHAAETDLDERYKLDMELALKLSEVTKQEEHKRSLDNLTEENMKAKLKEKEDKLQREKYKREQTEKEAAEKKITQMEAKRAVKTNGKKPERAPPAPTSPPPVAAPIRHEAVIEESWVTTSDSKTESQSDKELTWAQKAASAHTKTIVHAAMPQQSEKTSVANLMEEATRARTAAKDLAKSVVTAVGKNVGGKGKGKSGKKGNKSGKKGKPAREEYEVETTASPEPIDASPQLTTDVQEQPASPPVHQTTSKVMLPPETSPQPPSEDDIEKQRLADLASMS